MPTYICQPTPRQGANPAIYFSACGRHQVRWASQANHDEDDIRSTIYIPDIGLPYEPCAALGKPLLTLTVAIHFTQKNSWVNGHTADEKCSTMRTELPNPDAVWPSSSTPSAMGIQSNFMPFFERPALSGMSEFGAARQRQALCSVEQLPLASPNKNDHDPLPTPQVGDQWCAAVRGTSSA